MAITILQPNDWMQAFISIFKNDTKYGFHNQQNPDDDVFKAYNVIQSIPTTANQIPALWARFEQVEADQESSGRPNAFLNDFKALADIFLVCLRGTEITYNDLLWQVPSELHAEPPNNIFFLLIEYVGQKFKDNMEIYIPPIRINLGQFRYMVPYYDGFMGIPDALAIQIGLELEVQLE